MPKLASITDATEPCGALFRLAERGIDSSGAALAAATLTGRSSYGLRVQTLPWAEFVEPEGSSAPPHQNQKRALVGPGFGFGFGGEGGIRTLDTLPYTHFPGVRLRPLGHLSVGAQCSTAPR